jgi:hypothetical protein
MDKLLKNKINALDSFIYTDLKGVKAKHLKKLPFRSKVLFIKIFERVSKKYKGLK